MTCEIKSKDLNKKSYVKCLRKVVRFSIKCAQMLFYNKLSFSDLADVRSRGFRSFLI
jgi:hypothetical protein